MTERPLAAAASDAADLRRLCYVKLAAQHHDNLAVALGYAVLR